MLSNLYSGVSVGVVLGALLTPIWLWAWARVRLTAWLGFVALVCALISIPSGLAELWGWWSLPVFVVAGVSAFFFTRALSTRVRERSGYRPTGVFLVGKAPPGVRDWVRD